MSKYKTPFEVQISPQNIQIANRRYRLPFKKDQASQERVFQMTNQNTTFLIKSRVKEKQQSSLVQSKVRVPQKDTQAQESANADKQLIAGQQPKSIYSSQVKARPLYVYNGKKSKLNKRYGTSSQIDQDAVSSHNEQSSKMQPLLPVIGERGQNKNLRKSQNAQYGSFLSKFENGLQQFKERQKSKRSQKKAKLRIKSNFRRSFSRSQKQLHNLQMQTNLQAKKIKNRSQQFNRLPQPTQNPLAFIQALRASIGPSGQKIPIDNYFDYFKQIQQINPFFRKAGKLGGCILLSVGKLKIVDVGRPAYLEGSQVREVFVIVYGRFLMSNKFNTFRKMALTGETLGQAQIFQGGGLDSIRQGKVSTHQQQARALTKSCVLKIDLVRYFRMLRELNRCGYRQIAHTIDSLFRINFLDKQGKIKEQGRQRIVTEGSKSKNRTILH